MALLGVLLLAAPRAAVAAKTPQPHILQVIVDDFGFANTNYNRAEPDPEVSTPHMDALVASGVHFMRHYVHAECTPTRVSFQTGRLPMHSGQPGLCSPTQAACGIPYEATGIATKLRGAGYATHFVGKWDCGMATQRHTPAGKGYQTALNYFGHGNYQWGQIEWGANGGGNAGNTEPPSDPRGDNASLPRDLWDFDKPAIALSDVSRDEGVYEEDLFHQRIHSVLHSHAAKYSGSSSTAPLFLTYAARIAHYPIQAPISYQKLPNIAAIDVPHRRVYHAQIEYLDSQLGNLTAAYKQLGLWGANHQIILRPVCSSFCRYRRSDCAVGLNVLSRQYPDGAHQR
jgi:arylsulfatase B